MRFLPLIVLSLILFSCVPCRAADNTAMEAGEEMIINAISKLIVNFANDILAGVGGVETGKLNNSENYSGEQVAIFAIAAHTIDPTKDEAILQEVENTKQVYIYGMKLFALLLAAFMLFQQMWPSTAANVVGTFRGQPGYVTINEMAEYYIIVGLWFFIGPAILYSSLFLNNYLTQSLTLSVLDHVVLSSDNVGFFATMTGLYAAMMSFFAVRIDLIILAVKVWFLFGLILAVKRIRWAGVISVPYILGYVFSQFIIVWIVVSVVIYSNSHDISWYGSGFLYLGMFLIILGVAFLFVWWPLILRIIFPKTYHTIILFARDL